MGQPTVSDLLQTFLKLAIGGAWVNDISATYPTGLSGIDDGTGGATPLAESISASGTTTVDHTANMVVATVAVPSAGTYSVWLQLASSAGTPVAADMVNYELRVNGVSKLKPIASAASAANVLQAYLIIPAAATVSVNCIGAGTTSVRAAASINLTRIA